MFEESQDVFVE